MVVVPRSTSEDLAGPCSIREGPPPRTTDVTPSTTPVSASAGPRHTVSAVPAPTADLRWDAQPTDPAAVVLVLHGGQEHSTARNAWWRPPVWWMNPFAWVARRAGGGTFAVARIRYAVRGWNDDDRSPLHDTRAVLDSVAARYPGVPIALVGHSMGGRVALNLLGDERVSVVVGLAPWVDRVDVDAQVFRPHPGLRLLVLHGLADRITSPKASRALVERLAAAGTDARFVGLDGDKHAMIHRRRTWDRLLSAFLRSELLGDAPLGAMPTAEQRALTAGSVTTV